MLPVQHLSVCSELILGGDAETRQLEWASIWCMFSLGQVRLAAAAAAVAAIQVSAQLVQAALVAAAEDPIVGCIRAPCNVAVVSEVSAMAYVLQAVLQLGSRSMHFLI
jgi:hypothetical protein